MRKVDHASPTRSTKLDPVGFAVVDGVCVGYFSCLVDTQGLTQGFGSIHRSKPHVRELELGPLCILLQCYCQCFDSFISNVRRIKLSVLPHMIVVQSANQCFQFNRSKLAFPIDNLSQDGYVAEHLPT